jgi:hypothetical protein
MDFMSLTMAEQRVPKECLSIRDNYLRCTKDITRLVRVNDI